MRVVYSENFKRNVEKLPTEVKRQLKRKLTIMIENPRRPSLRTKKLKGRKDGIYEARSLHEKAFFQARRVA
jgi:mRNA interferase RelE/StbE